MLHAKLRVCYGRNRLQRVVCDRQGVWQNVACTTKHSPTGIKSWADMKRHSLTGNASSLRPRHAAKACAAAAMSMRPHSARSKDVIPVIFDSEARGDASGAALLLAQPSASTTVSAFGKRSCRRRLSSSLKSADSLITTLRTASLTTRWLIGLAPLKPCLSFLLNPLRMKGDQSRERLHVSDHTV